MMGEPVRLVSEHASPVGEVSDRTTDFEDLVQAEHGGLYGALCLLTRDRSEAEDLMQEAFLKVWERWDRVREMENPAGYVYRTALNLHRKRLRRASVAIRRAIGLIPGRDSLADVDSRDAVVRSLAALTPRQRVSIVLIDLLDYRSDEAAELMGVKASTVRVHASKGRAVLRRIVGETDE
jgi:RNA polymerase sigma-70 factor (ECF subfamily)